MGFVMSICCFVKNVVKDINTQSFIFLLLRKKNKEAELIILLAAKLDFPREKAVSKMQKSTHKKVLMIPIKRKKSPTMQTKLSKTSETGN